MKPKTKTTASLAVVGVDIGKEVFHLVGLGTDGTIAFRRMIRPPLRNRWFVGRIRTLGPARDRPWFRG